MNASIFEERLRAFFRSLVATLRARCTGKVPMAEIHRIAQEEVDALRTHEIVDWDEAAPVSIEQARRHAMLFQTVRIFGHVIELKDPQVETVGVPSTEDTDDEDDVAHKPASTSASESSPDRVALAVGEVNGSNDNDGPGDEAEATEFEDSEEEVTCVCIRDPHGTQIWSIDIYGAELITKLLDVRRSGLPAEFLGIIIAIPAVIDRKRPDAHLGHERRDLVLHLLDVRRSMSALNMLAASGMERQSVEDYRAYLARAGRAPLVELREQLIENLGIAATDEFRLLRDLIELVVLQALSIGRVNQASGRIHILVVGPPAQGKKLIGTAAKVLNPSCAELSSAKVSPAGLVGASHHSAAGWTSKPGLLPTAAYGVAWLQDAHGWSSADVLRVAPILQEVVEDGVVRDAVAGGRLREAPVALVVDANRSAQVTANAGLEAAILRVRPLISRIDVIAEIPSDVDRAWRVAGRMYDRLSIIEEGQSAEAPWVRECKLLVAALRDRHPVVDLAPVRSLMVQVHQQLHLENEELFAQMPDAGDIPTRLAISFARLVAASARGHDRGVAADEDVGVALRFLNRKLDYLRMRGAESVSAFSGRPDVRMSERQAWIVRTYAPGAVVTAREVHQRYTTETGFDVHEKSIRRDLNALGARRISKDRWQLPDNPDKPDTRTNGHGGHPAPTARTSAAGEREATSATTSDGNGGAPRRAESSAPAQMPTVMTIAAGASRRQLPLVDPHQRTITANDAFIREEVAKGEWRPFTVLPEVSGLPKPMTVLLAQRKDDHVKFAFHGDETTFCPPQWADIAIGSGACGYGCRCCFLMLTHRDLRDPLMPLVYENGDDFEHELLRWLTSDVWRIKEKYKTGKGRTAERVVPCPRPGKAAIGLGIDCSDSLLWEGVTGFARRFIPLFTDPSANPKNTQFVLLTKSANVHYLTELSDAQLRRVSGRVPNVAITMSLNPEPIADLWEGKYPDTLERITPPIAKRLEALRLAQDMGFDVRMRVDPILTPPGWEEMYRDFFDTVAHRYGLRPSMITLGTYREKNAQLDMQRAKWGLPEMEYEPDACDTREGTHVHVQGRAQVYGTVREMIVGRFKRTGFEPWVSLCKETHEIRKETNLLNANCNCLRETEAPKRRLQIYGN